MWLPPFGSHPHTLMGSMPRCTPLMRPSPCCNVSHLLLRSCLFATLSARLAGPIWGCLPSPAARLGELLCTHWWWLPVLHLGGGKGGQRSALHLQRQMRNAERACCLSILCIQPHRSGLADCTLLPCHEPRSTNRTSPKRPLHRAPEVPSTVRQAVLPDSYVPGSNSTSLMLAHLHHLTAMTPQTAAASACHANSLFLRLAGRSQCGQIDSRPVILHSRSPQRTDMQHQAHLCPQLLPPIQVMCCVTLQVLSHLIP